MTLDTELDSRIRDATTIQFGEPLGRVQTESLLDYIAKELPGSVNYGVEFRGVVSESRENYTENSLQFHGMISANDGKFDSFETSNISDDEGYTNKIQSLNFLMTPGFSWYDYRDEVKVLWKDVRTIVNRYFEEGRHAKE